MLQSGGHLDVPVIAAVSLRPGEVQVPLTSD
jgi:hypothetical protein